MEYYQRYELKKVSPQSDEFTLFLYLDDNLTEFADELGRKPRARKELIASARQVLKEKYPNVKVTMVKVILGGMVVTSIPLMTNNSTYAAETGTSISQVQETNGIYYTVSSGDTLWNISKKFNTSIESIKLANNLSSDVLKVNQHLIIPKAFHKVTTGDYLTVLAKKYGVSVDAIKDANNLTSDATKLGQTLIIPTIINGTAKLSTDTQTSQDSVTTNKTSTYTVVAGDSLSVIAKRFNTSVEVLKESNKLTSDFLRVGQTLVIPEGQQPTQPTVEVVPISYTVVSGDSLSVIAKRFGTTIDALKTTNNLTSDFLSIGQVLQIPTDTPPTTEKVPEPTNSTYTVVSGDNLWDLAKRFNTSVTAIRDANNLKSDILQLGQTLAIPTNITAVPRPESTQTEPTTEGTNTSHTVVAGDSLWGIATRYNLTVDAIRSANNLNTDVLQIGQKLEIPKANSETKLTPTVQEEEKRGTFVYAVRSGDNLSVLAERFGVSVDAIRSANNLKTDTLQLGQALTIPNGITTTNANTITYITHTVVSGDNIWDLSVRYGIPQPELLRANNLTTSSMLSLGQKLKIPVHNIAVKEVVSAKHGEYLDWWTEAQYVFAIGKTAKVTDLTTGKSFYIKRTIGANHADSETVSTNDTNIAKSIWGGFSWTPRAVLLEVDGRKLAASMSFMPHEREYISNNGISGHFDVYFGNSTRHKDGLPDPSHQTKVEIAAGIR